MKRIFAAVLGVFVLLSVALYFLFPRVLFRAATDATRYAAGLSVREIRADDHRIVYLEGGKGPTVILLHGFGANKDYWVPFAKQLTGAYHVIIPDLPGFGETSKLPDRNYDIASQTERLDRFVKALSVDRFHLAGNSMGGMLAALYGSRHPGKVLTLALLAPGGLDSPQKSQVVQAIEKGSNPLLLNKAEDFDRAVVLAYEKPPFIPPPFKKIFIAQALADRDFNAKVMRDIIRERLALDPVLPSIQAPVLILWGDKDRVMDVSGVKNLEKGLKRSTTFIMKDVGHIPMLEQPHEAGSAYLGFLKKL